MNWYCTRLPKFSVGIAIPGGEKKQFFWQCISNVEGQLMLVN